MRKALISVLTMWCLVVPQMILAGDKESTKFDYDNNIGFMKEVPKELQEAFPMCDEFLDVKWIREMPGGYWVGRVVIDVKIGDKTEQRELVVLEDQRKRRHGRFQLIDITESKYRGSQFDKLVMLADRISGKYTTLDSDIVEKGLSIWRDKMRVLAVLGICGSQSYLDRGVASRYAQNSTKKLCIIHPDKKRWLFKKK